MKLSEAGRQLIKSFEGLRLEAYPDGTNADGSPRYSIGYGHNGVVKGTRITREQAEAIFLADVSRFETAVNNLVHEPRTTQAMFDALTSLAWNIGDGALQRSTLLQLHNDGFFQSAADDFGRWIHAGGVIDPRLVKRRELEREFYVHGLGIDAPGLPSAPIVETRPPVAAAGLGFVFFCPSCGGALHAKLDVEKGIS